MMHGESLCVIIIPEYRSRNCFYLESVTFYYKGAVHEGYFAYCTRGYTYMAETITADMIIHDVVSKHPATVKVFHGHGLPCTACAVGSRESVAGGARTHRFGPEKLALLLEDLNLAANGKATSIAPQKAPIGRGVPLQMSSSDPSRKIKQVIA